MRVGISGTHGTGKTTLAEALCAHLLGHVAADEPYYLLADEGYEFGFPPSQEDYRAMLARSVRTMTQEDRDAVIFDRTPLDYLAYLAAAGADPGGRGRRGRPSQRLRQPRPAGHHADHTEDRTEAAGSGTARTPLADERSTA
jgi:hypothetical protein